jgi:hypothetical protein
LDHYRQKLTLFGHQLEEQLDSLQAVTRYPQSKIDGMFQDFEEFLKVLWDGPTESLPQPQQMQQAYQPYQPQQQYQHGQPPLQQLMPSLPQQQQNLSSALTVKNIHQILPRGVNEQ